MEMVLGWLPGRFRSAFVVACYGGCSTFAKLPYRPRSHPESNFGFSLTEYITKTVFLETFVFHVPANLPPKTLFWCDQSKVFAGLLKR